MRYGPRFAGSIADVGRPYDKRLDLGPPKWARDPSEPNVKRDQAAYLASRAYWDGKKEDRRETMEALVQLRLTAEAAIKALRFGLENVNSALRGGGDVTRATLIDRQGVLSAVCQLESALRDNETARRIMAEYANLEKTDD